MEYTVILDVRLNGDSFGTTEDIIESDSAEQAEQRAIQAWRAVRPDRTFAPLLTLPADPNLGGSTCQRRS